MASSADEYEASARGSINDTESSDQDSPYYSDSDDQTEEEEDSDSELGASGGQRPSTRPEPCKFYNSQGGCKDGSNCRYQHVCKYSLKGSCRDGHRCRLRHIGDSDSEDSGTRGGRGGRGGSAGRRSPGARAGGTPRRPHRRSPSNERELEDGEPYRWELDGGHGWKNIENDHILEAHYSRPSTKGINIYNTPYGMISIDFKHMRVLKKRSIRVRRRESGHTKWLWYYRGKKRWHQYGEKSSKRSHSSIKSSAIEAEYQKNRKGSHQFTVGTDTYEIRFKDMCQENQSSGQKSKICRRPLYESSQNHGRLTQRMRGVNFSGPAEGKWQFRGSGTNWHDFKPRSECSLSSADIEAQYQRNQQGRMSFTVSGQPYEIDFSTMTQINKATNRKRDVQRI